MTSGSEHSIDAYPGLVRRLGALLYDSLLVLAILMIATAVAMVLGKLVAGTTELHKNFPWLYRAWLVLWVYVFFAWFWTHGGQTLGMRAWKMRVQSPDGSNIGWIQATVRFFSATLSLGLGLLLTLFDPRRQSLYDKLSASEMIMVDARYVPPSN